MRSTAVDVRSGLLRYVINGPEMHRWHPFGRVHASCDFDYAAKLAIWD